MHKHTYMRSYETVNTLTCAGGIYADTHRSVPQNLQTCTLRDIIRSPYLKIRGNSENKASSKAKGGGGEQGGCWCVGGVFATEEKGRAPHERKGSGRRREGGENL